MTAKDFHKLADQGKAITNYRYNNPRRARLSAYRISILIKLNELRNSLFNLNKNQ